MSKYLIYLHGSSEGLFVKTGTPYVHLFRSSVASVDAVRPALKVKFQCLSTLSNACLFCVLILVWLVNYHSMEQILWNKSKVVFHKHLENQFT